MIHFIQYRVGCVCINFVYFLQFSQILSIEPILHHSINSLNNCESSKNLYLISLSFVACYTIHPIQICHIHIYLHRVNHTKSFQSIPLTNIQFIHKWKHNHHITIYQQIWKQCTNISSSYQ